MRSFERDGFIEFDESSGTGDQVRDRGLDSRWSLPRTGIRGGNGTGDLPPEICRYRDEGCEMAESCLECPFAKCVYEEPGGKRRRLRRQREKEIARLHKKEGKGIKEIAEKFGVCERTVQRDLKAAGVVILKERSD